MAEAERVLCRLRDVTAASITTDGDEIKEIHVVAESVRTPKNIVRDVETALKAFLKRSIDHRMISVAMVPPMPAAGEVAVGGPVPQPATPLVSPPTPAPSPAPAPPPMTP
ncbi:MAG: hypothetical protein ABIP29_04735, partial [Candidatus Eisenbacteria bacterium]